MDNELSIHLFFHSLGSLLRLLFCLVTVLREYGLLGQVAGDSCQENQPSQESLGLAGLRVNMNVLFFVCDFF